MGTRIGAESSRIARECKAVEMVERPVVIGVAGLSIVGLCTPLQVKLEEQPEDFLCSGERVVTA
jgi:hypothetical protein